MSKIARLKSQISNLREKADRMTETTTEVAAAAGLTFAIGYAEAQGALPAQIAGYDTDVVLGSGLLLYGFTGQKYSEHARAAGLMLLGSWVRQAGRAAARPGEALAA